MPVNVIHLGSNFCSVLFYSFLYFHSLASLSFFSVFEAISRQAVDGKEEATDGILGDTNESAERRNGSKLRNGVAWHTISAVADDFKQCIHDSSNRTRSRYRMRTRKTKTSRFGMQMSSLIVSTDCTSSTTTNSWSRSPHLFTPAWRLPPKVSLGRRLDLITLSCRCRNALSNAKEALARTISDVVTKLRLNEVVVEKFVLMYRFRDYQRIYQSQLRKLEFSIRNY